jgi:hypothetical protein
MDVLLVDERKNHRSFDRCIEREKAVLDTITKEPGYTYFIQVL